MSHIDFVTTSPSGGQEVILTGLEYPGSESISNAFGSADFRISRAWLCFCEQHDHGSILTNHSFLKFDLVNSSRSPWLGVTLQVREETDRPVSCAENTFAEVVLGLKGYQGPPNSCLYCVELNITSHPTVGTLIRILSVNMLTRFEFSSVTIPSDDEFPDDHVVVGCRDFIAQSLRKIVSQSGIERQFRPERNGFRPIAWTDAAGEWDSPDYKTLFQNNIFSALGYSYEDAFDPHGTRVAKLATSEVIPGLFLDGPPCLERGPLAPYTMNQHAFRTGTRPGQILDTREWQRRLRVDSGYRGEGSRSGGHHSGRHQSTRHHSSRHHSGGHRSSGHHSGRH